MKRFIGALLLATGIAAAAGACDDSSSDSGYPGPWSAGGDCSLYTTCGTCTPVNGCGWCFVPGGGGGACASGPDECMAESGEFTWTWNASGCPNVNASVGALDASPGDDAAAASQAEAGEAAPPTSLNPGNGDAGTSGEAGTSGAWPDASRD